MSQATEPLTQTDAADADLDLRALVVAVREMGASVVHVESGQQTRARAHGQMVVVEGFKFPTVASVRAAVAKVTPYRCRSDSGDATDFIFRVGEQVCRTIPWNGENGTVGVGVHLVPQDGDPTRPPSNGTGSGKTAALYAELKRRARPDSAEV